MLSVGLLVSDTVWIDRRFGGKPFRSLIVGTAVVFLKPLCGVGVTNCRVVILKVDVMSVYARGVLCAGSRRGQTSLKSQPLSTFRYSLMVGLTMSNLRANEMASYRTN